MTATPSENESGLIDRLAKIELTFPDEKDIRSTWLTVVEKHMIQASAFIRRQENWEQRLEDAASVEKWSYAARNIYKLSEPAVEYILKELRYYAKLGESSGSAAVLTTVDLVWGTQVSADDDLALDFKRDVVSVLENVPDKCKDWTDSLDPMGSRVYFDDEDTTDEEDEEDPIIAPTPPSRRIYGKRAKLVLHLLDPALYRLIFRRSPICAVPYALPTDAILHPHIGIVPGSSHDWMEAAKALNQRMSSEQSRSTHHYVPIDEDSLDSNGSTSQWVPSDIYVNADGSVDIRSYISDLHPMNHAAAYTAIAKVLSKSVPLFEQVLTDIAHRREHRVSANAHDCFDDTLLSLPTYNESDLLNYEESSGVRMLETWKQKLRYTEPVPSGFVKPGRPTVPYSLRNHHLQVYTKMTNIHLTPSEPRLIFDYYHVAGSYKECIIATAVYFYDISNVRNMEVRFSDARFGIYDNTDVRTHYDEILYGVSDNELKSPSNSLGSVTIRDGSIICFPNFYKRKFYNVNLADTSKCGHVKMCEFHIVDPSKRIISTAIVPPQQQNWKLNHLMVADSPLGLLPENIQRNIAKRVDNSISLNEARNLRKKMNTVHFYFEQQCGYSCEDAEWIPGYTASYSYGTRQNKS